MMYGGIQENIRGKSRFFETSGLYGLTNGASWVIFCEGVWGMAVRLSKLVNYL